MIRLRPMKRRGRTGRFVFNVAQLQRQVRKHRNRLRSKGHYWQAAR